MAVRGASAGAIVGQTYPNQIPAWTNPSNSVSGSSSFSSVPTQNSDYGKIMGNYDTLFRDARTNANARTQFQPVGFTGIPQYQSTGRLNDVANRLTGFADTGGYSEADLGNIRARGAAPIRSVYASALQNLKRQKSLQGGYSPNYGAIAAKMAREQAGILSEKSADIEAGIADRVQEGKRFGLSNLSPLAQRESELTHESKRENATGRQRVNELNANLRLDTERLNRTGRDNAISQALQATGGMTNLYGTSPAQTTNFSNSVSSAPSVGVARGVPNTNVWRLNSAPTYYR